MKQTFIRTAGLALLLVLPACAASLDGELARDLSGKNLEGRLGVLRASCVEHASHHSNRKDARTGNYGFVDNCDAMAARILAASRAPSGHDAPWSFQPLLSQCYAQADNVRAKRSGPLGKAPLQVSQRPAFRRDARTICARYQQEFDAAHTNH